MKRCNSCDGIYGSLDVRFTKACDNNCPFCIERPGLKDKGMVSTKVMVEKTFSTGIKDVLILGGEPFLFPKQLFDYVTGIRPFVEKIYATTSLPAGMFSYFGTFNMLDGINVSLQSLDWLENNEIMKASSNHNRIHLLQHLINMWPYKIRVNLNLVKGNIDSIDKIFDSLITLQKMGCRNVKINELQHSSDLYVSFDDITEVKTPSPFAHGCQTPIDLPYIFMNVVLKRSCFLVESSRQASIKDLIKAVVKRRWKYTNKFAVLYEDGTITNGWMKGKQHENNKSV
jgi:hypothetical protein